MYYNFFILTTEFFTLPIRQLADFPSLQACREGIKGWVNIFFVSLWLSFFYRTRKEKV
jgi:hypothetical protein